jgi:hypothetical protein
MDKILRRKHPGLGENKMLKRTTGVRIGNEVQLQFSEHCIGLPDSTGTRYLYIA